MLHCITHMLLEFLLPGGGLTHAQPYRYTIDGGVGVFEGIPRSCS